MATRHNAAMLRQTLHGLALYECRLFRPSGEAPTFAASWRVAPAPFANISCYKREWFVNKHTAIGTGEASDKVRYNRIPTQLMKE